MTADLKKIFRAFNPAPLCGDESDLYVPLDDVRGGSSVISRLTRTIRFSAKSTSQLLAGSAGNGKSTEPRRVQKELENGDNRFFTVFCEVLEDIDPSNADFPDVLMAIMRQVAREFRERLGIKLQPGYFKQRWRELKDLLGSEVNFESLELEAGLAKFTAAIKNSPSTRDRIRKALEPTTDSLIGAANGVLGEAVAHAAKKGYAGIAIIVDDLEKLSVWHQPEMGGSVAEHLFLTRHAQLTAFKCHMIYNTPLAFAYCCKEREIADLYDMIAPAIIPMAKIFDHAGKEHTPGFDRFRAIIAHRLQKAGVEEKDVFANNAARDKAIAYSGG